MDAFICAAPLLVLTLKVLDAIPEIFVVTCVGLMFPYNGSTSRFTITPCTGPGSEVVFVTFTVMVDLIKIISYDPGFVRGDSQGIRNPDRRNGSCQEQQTHD